MPRVWARSSGNGPVATAMMMGILGVLLRVPCSAQAPTTLVSVNRAGSASGNSDSSSGAITPDGRYAVFQSNASDLVANDGNGTSDVFVRDLTSGITTLVSVDLAGSASGVGNSASGAISADGHSVVFDGAAGTLVANDTNGTSDVFVRDLAAGTTTLVSVNGAGSAIGNAHSGHSAIGPDGRYVVSHAPIHPAS